MLLLNPRNLSPLGLDVQSLALMRETVGFFEAKGKKRLKDDDRDRVWYRDFLDFQKERKLFATLLTPSALGRGRPVGHLPELRPQRNPRFLRPRLLVHVAGDDPRPRPFWMSRNETMRRRAAALLREGGIFGFGLSEKEHGADIYSTEMRLAANPGSGFLANGRKYYIGNANEAALLSILGKMPDGRSGSSSPPTRGIRSTT